MAPVQEFQSPLSRGGCCYVIEDLASGGKDVESEVSIPFESGWVLLRAPSARTSSVPFGVSIPFESGWVLLQNMDRVCD